MLRTLSPAVSCASSPESFTSTISELQYGHSDSSSASSSRTSRLRSRELPMPAVPQSCNLDQAQATLQLCSDKLHALFRRLNEINPDSQAFHSSIVEMRRLHAWLDGWEHCFSTYLSRAVNSMTPQDIEQGRVLKANHLSCFVIASVSGADRAEFRPYDREFAAIVGLATAILETRRKGDTPRPTDGRRPVMTIADPLLLVQSFCHSFEVRARATKLLAQWSAING